MPRFMTVETYDGDITAHPDKGDHQAILADSNIADWVWQFADSPAQAIAQHVAKQDEWTADMDAGRPQKDTY